MERLTKRDNDGQAMMDCEKCKADWTGKHGKPMDDCTALYCRNRLKDRLAAYEDRECAPEEVLPKDKADEIALKLMRLADLESLCSRADFGWTAGCGRYRAGDGLHTKKMKVSGLPSKAKAIEAWNRRADNG